MREEGFRVGVVVRGREGGFAGGGARGGTFSRFGGGGGGGCDGLGMLAVLRKQNK